MKKDSDSLFPLPGNPGRPKTSPLTRQEQMREAQARRRALLRAEGITSYTFLLREDTAAKLRAIAAAESASMEDALALAVAKHDDMSTNLSGLPAKLVDSLEKLYPESILPDALIQAAARWVAEVKRKRASAQKSRRKQKQKR